MIAIFDLPSSILGPVFSWRVTKVLVIGSGGREHALVWKIGQSPKRRA